jgi:hypothetical protein
MRILRGFALKSAICGHQQNVAVSRPNYQSCPFLAFRVRVVSRSRLKNLVGLLHAIRLPCPFSMIFPGIREISSQKNFNVKVTGLVTGLLLQMLPGFQTYHPYLAFFTPSKFAWFVFRGSLSFP